MELGLAELLSGGNLAALGWVIAKLEKIASMETSINYYEQRIKRLEGFVLKKA